MTRNHPKNIAASVRQRLLNKSRQDKRPFQELVQYYAMERFLYRLSCSSHVQQFILKGALMLRVWHSPESRPTMDIDMLGKASNEQHSINAQIEDIIATSVEPDGLTFDCATLTSEHITQDAEYKGIRVHFMGKLDTVRLNMQIDVGFGDIVYPAPEMSEIPTILDFSAPRLLCYSRESAIAEKFEAMVKHRELNSRMKDFYDIWLLSRQFDFEGEKLARAIEQTFKQRENTIPNEIIAFTDKFCQIQQVQWAAFRKKLKQEQIPESLGEIVKAIEKFLIPIVKQNTSEIRSLAWNAGGSWTARTKWDK